MRDRISGYGILIWPLVANLKTVVCAGAVCCEKERGWRGERIWGDRRQDVFQAKGCWLTRGGSGTSAANEEQDLQGLECVGLAAIWEDGWLPAGGVYWGWMYCFSNGLWILLDSTHKDRERRQPGRPRGDRLQALSKPSIQIEINGVLQGSWKRRVRKFGGCLKDQSH